MCTYIKVDVVIQRRIVLSVVEELNVFHFSMFSRIFFQT